MPKIFFFYLFLKNFDHKTRTKLADEENASKSFDLICFYKADALSWIEFFYFFPDIFLPFIGLSLRTIQNIILSVLKPKP